MNRFAAWRGHTFLSLAARLYLGVVFLLACHHKIIHPQAFAVDIATYEILPLGLVNMMAIILPWIELAAGVMLIIGWRTRSAALLVTGMMMVFTIAISMALHKGLDMSCGCFASQGAVEDPISWRTIVRDSGWLLLGAYVLVFDRKPIGVDGWLARRRPSVQQPDSKKGEA
jgi:putative oxidoreductase